MIRRATQLSIVRTLTPSCAARGFDTNGLGPAALAGGNDLIEHLHGLEDEWQAARFHKRNRHEWAGIYVFVTISGHPFYVGISRTICRRLRHHLRGTTHNQAT